MAALFAKSAPVAIGLKPPISRTRDPSDLLDAAADGLRAVFTVRRFRDLSG